MSNTFKTNNARTVRKLNRVRLDEFNYGDRSTSDELWLEQRRMEVNGVRYGNHRRWKAAEKVQRRRTDRKRQNREIDTDF